MRASEKQMDFAKSIANYLHIQLPGEDAALVNRFINENIKTYNQKKYLENVERIKREIAITDYAEELGFHLIRRGRYFSLKEHDSVIIDAERNCFWRNSEPGRTSIGKGDSIIGFVQMFTSKNMKEIIRELSEKLEKCPVKENVSFQETMKREGMKNSLHLPEASKSMRKVFAYLIISRYIDRDIVQDFVNRKMIYQDLRNNCVFVAYDGEKPVYGFLRGTNTNKRFIGDVPGNDYEKGFYIGHDSSKLIISESVIDAMSIMALLKAKGINYKAYDYLPLMGTGKLDALYYRLDRAAFSEIILAVDNDNAGKRLVEKLKKELPERGVSCPIYVSLPEAKDWNQEIKDAFKNGIPISKIPFFQIKKHP